MATEEGIVIKAGGIAPRTAWVKTTQSSACKSCSQRNSCNGDSQGKEREVEAINLVGAKAGDLIQISIDTGALLKATFLLYIFPVICMLMGGVAGHKLGAGLGTNPSPISALIAVICFLGAMFIVRLRAGRMALKMEYRPKITRIIGRADLEKTAPGNPGGGCSNRIPSSI
jgi:sigma-E factor negative regulatory protein RseC